MIRRGKEAKWLSSSTTSLRSWTVIHDIELNNIDIGTLPGLESKGSAIKAQNALTGPLEKPLMIVPRELILSLQSVQLHAKSDRHLRDVLDASGDFGRVRYDGNRLALIMAETQTT